MAGQLRLAISAGEPVSDAEGHHRRCAEARNGQLGLTGANNCPGRGSGSCSGSGTMSGAMNGTNLNLMTDGVITKEGYVRAVFVEL